MTDPPGAHLTAGHYSHEIEETSMASDTPAPPASQPSPEPLVNAEMVRSLILAAMAAGWIAPIPDPVLGIVVPIAVTVIGVAVSWGLTLVSRGKVYALRHGVDADAVVDELQRRTPTDGDVR